VISSLSLADQPALFVDCQTTGPNPAKGNLLEITWFIATAKEPPSVLVSNLVKQPEDAPIPHRISKLTGIKTAELTDAIDKEEVSRQFHSTVAQLSQPAISLAHFARFERPFLQDLISAGGAGIGDADGDLLPFQLICTYEIAKRLFPNLPSKSIRAIAGYFGTECGEMKRAQSHAHATWQIWRGLVDQLRAGGVDTVGTLQAWLTETPQPKRTKYQYPLERSKRLSLPHQPGVYRMLNSLGNVLYVGKATSLKDRVNSYFRGNGTKDTKTKELLSQVFDLNVTVCSTPLEAALLETDEIKRLDPPYNRALKQRDRTLLFYSPDFESASQVQTTDHPIGPFANLHLLEPLQRLSQSIRENNFREDIFHRELPKVILSEAFQIFCINSGLEPNEIHNSRSLIALGLWLVRKEDQIRKRQAEQPEVEEEPADETTADETTTEQTEPDTNGLNSESISTKFERLLRRIARLYLRAKALTGLLDIEVNYTHGDTKHNISVRRGIIYSGASSHESVPIIAERDQPWAGLDVTTYDRMSVLFTGLSASKSAILVPL